MRCVGTNSACIVQRPFLKPYWSSQIKFNSFGLELCLLASVFEQCLVSGVFWQCLVSGVFGQCLVSGVF